MSRRLKGFDTLTPAEERLRDEIGLGEGLVFGDGEVPPEEVGPERTVTAEFLRHLMLGGRADLPQPMPETGVQIEGAWITGILDLDGARCPRDLAPIACRIEGAPIIMSAETDGLYLDGTVLPVLVAEGLWLRGNVRLRKARVTGEIRLPGARIGGNLSFNGATLTEGVRGEALSADGIQAEGSVFQSDGFSATGEVRLLGARIGGDLDCAGATLTARQSGEVLSAKPAEIAGTLFLQGAPGSRVSRTRRRRGSAVSAMHARVGRHRATWSSTAAAVAP